MDSKTHVVGLSIYQDSRGRDVYYDRLTKNAYLIQEKNIKQYSLYSKRFIFAFVIFALVSSLELGGKVVGPLWGSILGLGGYIAFECGFRFKFLKNLVLVSNFTPTRKKTYLEQIKESNEKGKAIMKGISYLLLGVLLILLGIDKQFNLVSWIICGVLAVSVIINAIIYFMAAFKMQSKG